MVDALLYNLKPRLNLDLTFSEKVHLPKKVPDRLQILGFSEKWLGIMKYSQIWTVGQLSNSKFRALLAVKTVKTMPLS